MTGPTDGRTRLQPTCRTGTPSGADNHDRPGHTGSCRSYRPTSARETRIGVLFVHGMGEQKRGSSLQKWGDPIVQWIRRWETRDFDPELLAILEPEPVTTE